MRQSGDNRMTAGLTPFVPSYYTKTNVFHLKSCILVAYLIRSQLDNNGLVQIGQLDIIIRQVV